MCVCVKDRQTDRITTFKMSRGLDSFLSVNIDYVKLALCVIWGQWHNICQNKPISSRTIGDLIWCTFAVLISLLEKRTNLDPYFFSWPAICQIWFALLSLFNWLFNAKFILEEKQRWDDLTHSFRGQCFNRFLKGITPKLKVEHDWSSNLLTSRP